jgi:hypothetical protein
MNINNKMNRLINGDIPEESKTKVKVEIVDNELSICWELNYYRFKKLNKWYESTNYGWHKEWCHIMGKNYMCPNIHKGKTTANEMFNEEVKRVLDNENDNIIQVHRVKISKK